MDFFLDTWSVSVEGGVSLYLGIAFVYALLLGWVSYTDLFQNKTIPNTASMGMIFASLAVTPFLYENVAVHLLWSAGIALFFFVAFFLGAIADGDLKIYLAFALLLGPAALLAALISWVVIFLYSLPIIYRTLRSKKTKAKGERLGIAPAAPGIALSLPLTLLLLGISGEYVALFFVAMAFSFLASFALYRLDAKANMLDESKQEE